MLIPYRMYIQYGDINVLKDNYDNMVKYAKFMLNRYGNGNSYYVIYNYYKSIPLSKENKKYGVNCGQS